MEPLGFNNIDAYEEDVSTPLNITFEGLINSIPHYMDTTNSEADVFLGDRNGDNVVDFLEAKFGNVILTSGDIDLNGTPDFLRVSDTSWRNTEWVLSKEMHALNGGFTVIEYFKNTPWDNDSDIHLASLSLDELVDFESPFLFRNGSLSLANLLRFPEQNSFRFVSMANNPDVKSLPGEEMLLSEYYESSDIGKHSFVRLMTSDDFDIKQDTMASVLERTNLEVDDNREIGNILKVNPSSYKFKFDDRDGVGRDDIVISGDVSVQGLPTTQVELVIERGEMDSSSEVDEISMKFKNIGGYDLPHNLTAKQMNTLYFTSTDSPKIEKEIPSAVSGNIDNCIAPITTLYNVPVSLPQLNMEINKMYDLPYFVPIEGVSEDVECSNGYGSWMDKKIRSIFPSWKK